MAMSHHIIISKPPATANPCTIAMVGLRTCQSLDSASRPDERTMRQLSDWEPRASPDSSLRSRPAQNARPRPRMRMARTSSSLFASCSASSRSRASVLLIALSASGRFSQIVATLPSWDFSYSSVSNSIVEPF